MELESLQLSVDAQVGALGELYGYIGVERLLHPLQQLILQVVQTVRPVPETYAGLSKILNPCWRSKYVSESALILVGWIPIRIGNADPQKWKKVEKFHV